MPWTTTPPRARHSLEGSALGDAFGERWFPLFRDLPQAYEEIRARRAPEEPDWHWTDDTAMALGIFRVLDEHGEIRQPELAQAFALGYDADPGLRLRHAPTAPAPPPGAGPLGGTGTRTLRRRGQPRQRMGVPPARAKPRAWGSVRADDTVPFAVWCAVRHPDDLTSALWSTAEGFGDVDTTCAITGGIVGARTGVGHVPEEWLSRREAVPGAG